MSLNEPSVGTTAGPTWATEVNENFTTIDQHDHTSGKGVQLTTSALNINADLEFNGNAATELKRLTIDSSATGSGTNYSVYQSGGNLFWYNGSGQAVQITDGSAVKTTGGSISGMSSDAAVQFSVNAYVFKWDTTTSPQSVAKISCSDISLYNFSNYNDLVTLKYTGSGASSVLTLPDETGTLLSTATSFAGAISLATSASNANITLSPNGTGKVVVGNGGATGKVTSNGAYDLVLDTNSGTNSGNITITDGADGNISFIPNGTGEIVIGSGSASGKITSSGAYDLVLDTNAGTNSGNITITDGANGAITITPNGSGVFTIGGSWTAASQTCANLGTVTTADLNGGTIDGMTIGASSHTTGKFTTCDATTDFTIGDTVITDGQIADAGDFTFDIEGDLVVDVNGGDITYKDDGTAFFKVSLSGGNTTISNG